jgi:hypothetical protein
MRTLFAPTHMLLPFGWLPAGTPGRLRVRGALLTHALQAAHQSLFLLREVACCWKKCPLVAGERTSPTPMDPLWPAWAQAGCLMDGVALKREIPSPHRTRSITGFPALVRAPTPRVATTRPQEQLAAPQKPVPAKTVALDGCVSRNA